MTDKRKCKYYQTCGNKENCQRCTGYEKENKEKKDGKSNKTL